MREVINEDGWLTGTDLYVLFQDGTERKLFDGYIKKEFFAEYVNEVIALLNGQDHVGREEQG
ncbi:MAG: hypothetical protein NC541_08270 [bacterium]|nr:hypothetical protein [bacterium]